MSSPPVHRDARADIAASFGEAGLAVHSVVSRAVLEKLAGLSDSGAVARYGLLESAAAVVVAFPYDPRPGSRPDPSSLSVGAFAANNRYATMTRLLLSAGRSLAGRSGLPAKGFRAVVNSRLPEKLLGELAGLGFIGRSSLLVTRDYGPACLLGALLFPRDYMVGEDVADDPAGSDPLAAAAGAADGGCGACTACADACPTGAIRRGEGRREGRAGGPGGGPGIDQERCIQHWTTTPGEVPGPVRAAWGARLYGCDECVAACPRSAAAWSRVDGGPSPTERADALVAPGERRPGRSVPAAFVERASDAELRAFFRKTALGMSWIRPEELRRNATLSLEFLRSGQSLI